MAERDSIKYMQMIFMKENYLISGWNQFIHQIQIILDFPKDKILDICVM